MDASEIKPPRSTKHHRNEIRELTRAIGVQTVTHECDCLILTQEFDHNEELINAIIIEVHHEMKEVETSQER